MVITWEEYFMGLAQMSALRSKDPNTQVGACITDNETNRILSLGYNGFPTGCSDYEFPWGKGNPDEYDNKYSYVVHAEANAILNAGRDLRGSTLYTTLSPCKECTKLIIQAGIKKVVYNKKFEHDEKIVRRMFDAAGVKVERYEGKRLKIEHVVTHKFDWSALTDHEEVELGD